MDGETLHELCEELVDYITMGHPIEPLLAQFNILHVNRLLLLLAFKQLDRDEEPT